VTSGSGSPSGASALLAAEHVEAHVRRDAVEPGSKRRAALEPLEPLQGAKERLLHGVLGLERGAQHPIGVGGELGPMLLEVSVEVLDRDQLGHGFLSE
jgi:hypothetical protein